MKKLSPPAFALTLALLGHRSFATPGSLDLTFGGTGKVTTVFGAPSSANGIAVQSDGKIVVVGGSGDTGEFRQDAIIVRYNASGTLDTGFNGSGKVVGKFGANVTRNAFSGVVVQADGKVVAAGTANVGVNFRFSDDFIVVRRNADGSPDQNFTLGRVDEYDVCQGLMLQPDGKLILAGFLGNPGAADFGLLRLNSGLAGTGHKFSGRAEPSRLGEHKFYNTIRR